MKTDSLSLSTLGNVGGLQVSHRLPDPLQPAGRPRPAAQAGRQAPPPPAAAGRLAALAPPQAAGAALFPVLRLAARFFAAAHRRRRLLPLPLPRRQPVAGQGGEQEEDHQGQPPHAYIRTPEVRLSL